MPLPDGRRRSLARIPGRGRAQFSVRTLLLVVLVAAVLFAWLASYIRSSVQQRAAVEGLRKSGAGLMYDFQFGSDGQPTSTPAPSALGWLRDLVGNDFVSEVRIVALSGKSTTDAELVCIDKLAGLRELLVDNTSVRGSFLGSLVHPRLESLWLTNSPIDDHYLVGLQKLRRLRYLGLSGTPVTDDGLVHLLPLTYFTVLELNRTKISDKGVAYLTRLVNLRELGLNETVITDQSLELLRSLPHLRQLTVSKTRISNVGLTNLREMSELEVLDLGFTSVDDAGLEALHSMKSLKWINLEGSKVSEQGVEALSRVLPNCNMHYWLERDRDGAKGLEVVD